VRLANLEVKDIPLSEIKTFFYDMRVETKNGDPELMESIKSHGLMQPVLLRPMKPSGYQLIAGSRRLDAFKKLGRKEIPSIIRQIDDKTAFELALIENIQKRSLSDIEEAKAFREYLDKYSESIRDLAERIGKGKHYIVQRLFLIDWPKELPASVRKEIQEEMSPGGALTMQHVEKLSHLKEPTMVKEVARAVKDEKFTAEQTSELVSLVKDRNLPVEHAVQAVKIFERSDQIASQVTEELKRAVIESAKEVKAVESSEARRLMENYMYLGTLIKALEQGKIFCLDHKNENMLVWKGCRTPITETHEKLGRKLGRKSRG
jgi:ParB family chromosome partitioning protein